MKVSGQQREGKLIFLTFSEWIDWPSWEESSLSQEAKWVNIPSLEGKTENYSELHHLLGAPIFDDQGSPNYWLADDGAITERTEAEKQDDPERREHLARSISVEARVSAIEEALLSVLEG